MKKTKTEAPVAYFSMEIALDNQLKTFAGGLGILAGDLLKSAAEISFAMVGITLLNSEGYFKQRITKNGDQLATKDLSQTIPGFKKLNTYTSVKIGTEEIKLAVWQYIIKGPNQNQVKVYLLDSNLPENNLANRQLTKKLYGGDLEYRLKQEIILGRGGIKILQALGYKKIKKFHLNEGHGSLAPVELFLNSPEKKIKDKLIAVKKQCVFTTHTPLLHAQDIYSTNFFKQFQPDFPFDLDNLVQKDEINMTLVGLYFSGYANAVSKLHGPISNRLFPGYNIKTITNGVNSLTWTSSEFKKLYDKYLPGWRLDNKLLSGADRIPLEEIKVAHQKNKLLLGQEIKKRTRETLDDNLFTIGWARRFSPYKRPEFLFKNLNRLISIAKANHGLQIVLAGKAHPRDIEGQALIKQIYQYKKQLTGKVKIVILENYDIELAKIITAGVDLWLNTPQLFNEASGTSGMKAAHNGVPQLSTLDGWWPEAYKKNKTGWAIKESSPDELYDILENDVLPTYHQPEKWLKIQQQTISYNASRFNSHRALKEYIKKAYK